MESHGEHVEVEPFVDRARSAHERRRSSWLARGVKTFSYLAGVHPAFGQELAQAAILFFHKVQQRPKDVWGERVLDVEEFERQVAFLAREYQPIPLSGVLAALRGEGRLPSRAVVLTFDDGYRNNLLLAAPVLRRYRVDATFFITTGLVGTEQWMWAYELEAMFHRHPLEVLRRSLGHPALAQICALPLEPRVALRACVDYLKAGPDEQARAVMQALRRCCPVELDDENRFLSWDEVRALERMGFEVGAHTVTHPILVRVPWAQAEAELEGSRARLARELLSPPRYFAYPNGDTDPSLTALSARTFAGAVTTQPRLCSGLDSPWELPRIGAPVTVSELAFELARHSLPLGRRAR